MRRYLIKGRVGEHVVVGVADARADDWDGRSDGGDGGGGSFR